MQIMASRKGETDEESNAGREEEGRENERADMRCKWQMITITLTRGQTM